MIPEKDGYKLVTGGEFSNAVNHKDQAVQAPAWVISLHLMIKEMIEMKREQLEASQ